MFEIQGITGPNFSSDQSFGFFLHLNLRFSFYYLVLWRFLKKTLYIPKTEFLNI